jgi:hypothetical protein
MSTATAAGTATAMSHRGNPGKATRLPGDLAVIAATFRTCVVISQTDDEFVISKNGALFHQFQSSCDDRFTHSPSHGIPAYSMHTRPFVIQRAKAGVISLPDIQYQHQYQIDTKKTKQKKTNRIKMIAWSVLLGTYVHEQAAMVKTIIFFARHRLQSRHPSGTINKNKMKNTIVFADVCRRMP